MVSLLYYIGLFFINAIFICYSTMNDVSSKSVLSTVYNELNFI